MTLKTFDISKFVIPNSLSFKYQVYMSSDCKDTGTLKLEFEASVQFCLLLEPKHLKGVIKVLEMSKTNVLITIFFK